MLLYDGSKPDGDTGIINIAPSPSLKLGPLEQKRLRFEFGNGSDNLSMKDNTLKVVFRADRTAADGSVKNNENHILGPEEPVEPAGGCTE